MMTRTLMMLMQMMLAMILTIIINNNNNNSTIIINNTEKGRKEKDLWKGHILGSVLNHGCNYIYARYRPLFESCFYSVVFFRTRFNNLSLTNETLRTSGI